MRKLWRRVRVEFFFKAKEQLIDVFVSSPVIVGWVLRRPSCQVRFEQTLNHLDILSFDGVEGVLVVSQGASDYGAHLYGSLRPSGTVWREEMGYLVKRLREGLLVLVRDCGGSCNLRRNVLLKRRSFELYLWLFLRVHSGGFGIEREELVDGLIPAVLEELFQLTI